MESYIVAYFRSLKAAESVRDLMVGKGFGPVQIDRISLFPGESVPSLEKKGEPANLTDVGDRDTRVLVANNPAFGGLSDVEENADRYTILLTIVCPAEKADEVRSLAKEGGGLV